MASTPAASSDQYAAAPRAPGKRQPMPTMAMASGTATTGAGVGTAVVTAGLGAAAGGDASAAASSDTLGCWYSAVGGTARPSHRSSSPDSPTASRDASP